MVLKVHKSRLFSAWIQILPKLRLTRHYKRIVTQFQLKKLAGKCFAMLYNYSKAKSVSRSLVKEFRIKSA